MSKTTKKTPSKKATPKKAPAKKPTSKKPPKVNATKQPATKDDDLSTRMIISRAIATAPGALHRFIEMQGKSELRAIYAELTGSKAPPALSLQKIVDRVVVEIRERQKAKDAAESKAESATEAASAPAAAPEPVAPTATDAPQDATDAAPEENVPPAENAPENATEGATVATTPRAPDPRLPAVGTVIVKKDRHGNERARCTVVEGGILYRDVIYKSISAAAMAAARDLGLGGRSQNGFTFWNLSKPAPRPADAVESIERAWERYRERLGAAMRTGDEDARVKVRDALRGHLGALHEIAKAVA